MGNPYRIKFTPLAEAFAKAKWTLAAVEEQARGELAESALDIAERGKKFENWRGFHTLCMPNQSYFDKNLFICIPADDEQGFYVKIDTSSVETGEEKLDAGPFKGYTVSIPRPDSED